MSSDPGKSQQTKDPDATANQKASKDNLISNLPNWAKNSGVVGIAMMLFSFIMSTYISPVVEEARKAREVLSRDLQVLDKRLNSIENKTSVLVQMGDIKMTEMASNVKRLVDHNEEFKRSVAEFERRLIKIEVRMEKLEPK